MYRFLTICFVTCLSTASLADVVAPNGKVIDCYCTDKTGNRVELGEYICLNVDGRSFMAQCQMSLNVPMWREISPGCVSSDARPHIGGDGIDPAIQSLSIHS